MNKKIFISYRRKDTGDLVGRLYDALVEKYGSKHVFKDDDTIPAGKNFKEHIRETISSSSVVLVIIGSNWVIDPENGGINRLNNENDFVRLEIETALSQGILTIPILVNEIKMPEEVSLPDPIKSLVYLQARRLHSNPSNDFRNDVKKITQDIDESIPSLNAYTYIKWGSIGTLALLLLAVMVYAFYFRKNQSPPDNPINNLLINTSNDTIRKVSTDTSLSTPAGTTDKTDERKDKKPIKDIPETDPDIIEKETFKEGDIVAYLKHKNGSIKISEVSESDINCHEVYCVVTNFEINDKGNPVVISSADDNDYVREAKRLIELTKWSPRTINNKPIVSPKKSLYIKFEPIIPPCNTGDHTISANDITLVPLHTGQGDREFEGHGPKMQTRVQLKISSNGQQVIATVSMKAQEWQGNSPRSDYTTAYDSKDVTIYTVTNGYKIQTINSPIVSSDEFVDTDHQIDYRSQGAGGLVRMYEYMGDGPGNDVEKNTKVKVVFNPIRITLKQTDNCQ